LVRIINTTNKEYFWDSISEDILKKAKKNWRKAVFSMKLRKYMRDYIINEQVRGKLAEFMERKLKITGGKKVLDIGCGMGALTIALARRFKTSATDTNLSTLRFVKYRAEQKKVNLNLYKTAQLHKKHGLPFKKEKFDVVVMNGVLEWVALNAGEDVGVAQIQEKVLKKIFKILKKKSIFILAIENRLALDWFKGKTSHINIKFIDLMPRFVGNLICKLRTGKPYRTYIYSKFGYERILKNVGFKDIKFYVAEPSYQKPKNIRKADRFSDLFAKSYIIVCRK